jgi:hypothetical protein
LRADTRRYTVICEADMMSSFLLLCEHVRTAYRIDDFIKLEPVTVQRMKRIDFAIPLTGVAAKGLK